MQNTPFTLLQCGNFWYVTLKYIHPLWKPLLPMPFTVSTERWPAYASILLTCATCHQNPLNRTNMCCGPPCQRTCIYQQLTDYVRISGDLPLWSLADCEGNEVWINFHSLGPKIPKIEHPSILGPCPTTTRTVSLSRESTGVLTHMEAWLVGSHPPRYRGMYIPAHGRRMGGDFGRDGRRGDQLD
jgi:hypothetical protein